MNKILANLLSLFVIGKERRRMFRRKLHPDNGEIFGKGNVVIGKPSECRVLVWGDNNHIEFQEPRGTFMGKLQIGFPDCPVCNCRIIVGPRTDSVGLTLWMLEDGSNLEIGSDCLISHQVQFWCSDTHALLDENGKVANASPHHIVIGDHSWIGFGVHVLKNVILPPGSIVGLGSVVAGKSFSVPNCAYAGNPARVVKEGVSWDKRRPKALAAVSAAGQY